ncbi:molybdopterin molybdotransferase MoeA [Rhizobium metallidurans]|uniref:Molybdopterin molybdenumtransferase n=1 Tax=Rhizobium metallidurans TaxID=1265931 RepID=A0A7W6CY53_9HYPH|nr:gephyrin-like molybdotransferase Glp [Rhizobium metallidurans]MBB3965855.1 molybdopterin molybdotransferase [Rhizobium metallidurans]
MSFRKPNTLTEESSLIQSKAEALIPVDDAIRRVLDFVAPVTDLETLPLDSAHGRVLAEATCARVSLPVFDNSAIDGYALRLNDLTGRGPWSFRIAGHVAAGDCGDTDWPAANALRILTGARVPAGCDTVVAQEDISLEGGSITVASQPAEGQNIRRRGEDIKAGIRLFPAGRIIDPRAAAVLAATGEGQVGVRRRVRIAILSTGSELVEPDQHLAPGQIWNANRYHLSGALKLPWIELLDFGIVPDNVEALRIVMEKAAHGADLVVSTGGISVGDKDHVPAAMKAAGASLLTMKLAMKPGRPLAVGRLDGALLLGLPGNPVASFVSWKLIGARVAEKLAGISNNSVKTIRVRAGFEHRRRPGRAEFIPAILHGPDETGIRVAEIATTSTSHRVALLAIADGLLCIPTDLEQFRRADLLDFLPF